MKKKERISAINGFKLCIDKLLTWVSGLPRSTATSIHPFVQYAKVTLLEISPCQCPTVKISGVAYSCSYALLTKRRSSRILLYLSLLLTRLCQESRRSNIEFSPRTRNNMMKNESQESRTVLNFSPLRMRVGFNSPWANSKKTSLNGCSFLSPGRNVCLLILKEKDLKMRNPFVGRKKSCRMLSKRNFFPPLLDDRYHQQIPDQVHVLAFKPVLTSVGLHLCHAWRSL